MRAWVGQAVSSELSNTTRTGYSVVLRNPAFSVAVKILLSNIILIGATKISVESDPSNPSQYYVPRFGAMMFATAEQFVVLCGYEGDEDVPSREGIFRAVALLQHAMVIHPDYATTPVEAPGYSSAQADPFFYGVGTRTKERQIREILDHGHLLHRVGDNLLRYDHTLGYPIPSSPSRLPVFKIRGPTYTIETTLPRLYSLSLPAETLHAKFFFPEDGLENFLQFRMHIFVHTLMRAITHDFTHFTSLPAFPPPEHQKLRAWIEILMTHFCLVSQTLKHRTESILAGDLSWASYSFHVPAEAFQMFKLSIFLCNFVGFTTPSRFLDDLDFPILYPMIDLSMRELMLSGSRSDYPEYDSRGRLQPGGQLFAQASSVHGFSPSVLFSPSSFHTTPLPMGFTDFAHLVGESMSAFSPGPYTDAPLGLEFWNASSFPPTEY
ncbi:hypothetical protein C8F04DRAFT_1197760 [Mycena alexandri]|uniref:Uncharacterized protein n=1 Tax=Mycena alexandri TaxID=1745969 RepID=A0AAD6S207_9AGAR|nr:hypothetical protein C8F04DRAFT_1197760 [Mycena alexandri]